MIHFFTETLSGLTYFIVLVVCIILILALIGVMSEIKYIKTIDEPIKNNDDKNSLDNNNIITNSN